MVARSTWIQHLVLFLPLDISEWPSMDWTGRRVGWEVTELWQNFRIKQKGKILYYTNHLTLALSRTSDLQTYKTSARDLCVSAWNNDIHVYSPWATMSARQSLMRLFLYSSVRMQAWLRYPRAVGTSTWQAISGREFNLAFQAESMSINSGPGSGSRC